MKSNYTNLDLLRSFAVLSVVVAHLWHGCVIFGYLSYNDATNQALHNLSFTGVMFFFVHTCLVLMLSLHRMPAEQRALKFLIRRAFRIYPLCWAAIVIALVTGLTDQTSDVIHALGVRGVLANVLLVQNVVRSAPSILGPLWSLPWEVQMYLLLPVFYLVLRRFERYLPALPLWLGAAALATIATLPRFPRAFHAAVFPPLFIAGMVAYQLLHRSAKREKAGESARKLPAILWPFYVLGLFALQGILVGWNSFESSKGALLNSTIALALGVGVAFFSELRAHWIVWPAEKIAKYSYGIYLLHVPALELVFRALPGVPLGVKVVLFFLATALFSVAAFHWIEDPLIQVGKRISGVLGRKSTVQVEEDELFVEPIRTCEYDAESPLVSIITPVYNAKRWLPETIQSVRAQSYKNWEMILVDDGSSDGSWEMLTALAADEPRLQIAKTAKNGGPSAARNLALEQARGRYIAFLDADDIWLPEKLERSIEWMQQHGYSFIYHDYRHLSHDGEHVGALIEGPEVLDLRTLHTRRGTGGCLSVVLDRAQIGDFSFPANFKFLHEDFCAWMSLIRAGHLGHRLPVDLGRYRLSPKSRSANKLNGAYNTWLIYREISRLPFLVAAIWWLQYAWNGFWLYRLAKPR